MSLKLARSSILVAMTEAWDVLGLGTREELEVTPDAHVLMSKVISEVRPRLIREHQLYEITCALLDNLSAHAKALSQLTDSHVGLMHGRQIQELATTFQFLLQERGRWDEFVWRWRNFPKIHAMRSRLFNLQKPLDNEHLQWIKDHLGFLQKFDAKFTGDVSKDMKLWKAFGNWLYPIPIRGFFKDTGREHTYYFQEYDWQSHSTHFSPIGERMYSWEFDGETAYRDVAFELAGHHVTQVLRLIAPLTVRPEEVDKLRLKELFRVYYHLMAGQPGRFKRIAEETDRLDMLVGEVVRQDMDRQRLEAILLGPPAVDPLVINFAVESAPPSPTGDTA